MDSEKEIKNDNQSIQSIGDKPRIGLRWILVYIIFATYVVIYFVRNSISITIVAMINETSTDDNLENSKDVCPAAFNKSSSSDSETAGEFTWSEGQKGLILGAYYWGYLLSRFFLSRIGEVLGQRQTVSIGIAGAGILALISPLSASFSPYALAATRFLTGLFYGPSSGSTMSLLSAWAPKNELASMSTTALSGATVGGLLSIFVSGWLSEQFSWHIVFYLGGFLNLLIPPIWIFFVRNSPAEHPLLSNYERNLLIENIKIKKKTKKFVPWLKIISSPYVAICIYTLFARLWLDIVINTEGPTFLRYKIGLDLDTTSYVSGVSVFFSFFFLLFFGKASDFIMNKNILSKTNTRKFFQIIASAGCSVLLAGVIIAGCNSTAVIVLWILIGGLGAASGVTFPLSIIDFAPNFTATINGLMAIGSLAGAVAPSVVSAFLIQGNGWNKSFYLAIGLNLLACVVYVLFMTSKPQPWNFEDEEKKESEINSSCYETKF